MTEYTLKILFHGGFYGHPLNGLAIYNGEEVYFNEHSSCGYIAEKDYTAEIKTAINCLKINDEDDLELEKYYIYRFNNNFVVERKLLYDIYRLPEYILLAYKSHMIEFSEAVGYHCWHDPQFHKPYLSKDNSEYYKNVEKCIDINIKELEHLGTFKYNEFQYYNRP
jgi:hypothetical protein